MSLLVSYLSWLVRGKRPKAAARIFKFVQQEWNEFELYLYRVYPGLIEWYGGRERGSQEARTHWLISIPARIICSIGEQYIIKEYSQTEEEAEREKKVKIYLYT
jgi:hypothetical protein